MNVRNKKCIRKLSLRNLKTSKQRNIIAISAIVLTTILFTTLFTIIISIAHGYEQSNFRQIGSFEHGEFKYLSKEQFDELKNDSGIYEYGTRIIVGSASDGKFKRSQAEISYCDENAAKWMFINPEHGRLPTENTDEAALDTNTLSALGITPEIGTEFDISFDVDGEKIAQSFILSGWWEKDKATPVSHILIPQSRAAQILDSCNLQENDNMIGTYSLSIMLKSSSHIEADMRNILERHNFQPDNPSDNNYINMGVNWGYISSQFSDIFDKNTLISIVALLLLIILTGHLIICNVFQISISNDIRRYGLLKTIGTTNRQIKRMVFIEAIILSIIAIPIGMIIGCVIGTVLIPYIAAELNNIEMKPDLNPVIFIFSGMFSLLTVILSCRKPAKTASRVSPVEALRYTECREFSVKSRASRKGPSFLRMASSNIVRNKKKTIITILSMVLSLALFNLTFTFSNGFDMNKYLSNLKCDYIAADADYFNVQHYQGSDTALDESLVSEIKEMGITAGGRTYAMCNDVYQFISEEAYKNNMSGILDDDTINSNIENSEKLNDLVGDNVMLYGMESFCLDKLNVVEGDVSKITNGSGYVASVCNEDDYGNVIRKSGSANIGDKVTIRYVEDFEYYNPDTGEVYESLESIPEMQSFSTRSTKYRDVEYEIAAIVTVPSSLSYRWSQSSELVMNSADFIKDSQCNDIMYYAFDVDNGAEDEMESFLSNISLANNSRYGYESKQTYADSFESFRGMFLILGGSLSLIVGLVGILNFLNTVLTGIISRQREFAVLRSIGMTSRQLKKTLMYEGLIFNLFALAAALLFSVTINPLIFSAIESMFWFFTYKFTLTSVLIVTPLYILLGMFVPIIVYRNTANESIVELLRKTE